VNPACDQAVCFGNHEPLIASDDDARQSRGDVGRRGIVTKLFEQARDSRCIRRLDSADRNACG
jgi:hypothetical protein